MNKIFLLSIVMVALCLNTACLTEQNHQNTKRYDEDGMLGLTNTNPNLRTNLTHYNYNADENLVEQAMDKVNSSIDYSLMINGGKMYVKLRLPDGLSRNEIEKIEAAAYDELSYQLPRYDLHVTSDKSNMRKNQDRNH